MKIFIFVIQSLSLPLLLKLLKIKQQDNSDWEERATCNRGFKNIFCRCRNSNCNGEFPEIRQPNNTSNS